MTSRLSRALNKIADKMEEAENKGGLMRAAAALDKTILSLGKEMAAHSWAFNVARNLYCMHRHISTQEITEKWLDDVI